LLENSTVVDDYKALMASQGFECLITEPTRIVGESATCIDHVYARVASSTMEVEAAVAHAGITDHSLCCVAVRGCDGRTDLPAISYRIDYNILNNALQNVDWSPVYRLNYASEAFDAFYCIFNEHVKASKVENTVKKTFNILKPWMNEFLLMKIKIRNKIYNTLKNIQRM